MPRLLTLHWIVQQAANVRFDHCDLFQLSSLWRWSCDGKSTRIARPPSRTTAYRSCAVQPNQCHCTPGSAVPFAPFQSPLSSSPCAFLSGNYYFALDTTFAYTPYIALLSHNGGSQIVLAWKNTHAPENNSFDCWWLQETLKYTAVALRSRSLEDTLPQQ